MSSHIPFRPSLACCVALLLVSAQRLTAEEDPPFFSFRTCYDLAGTHHCARASLHIEPFNEWEGSPLLTAVLSDWEPTFSIRPTAFGFYGRPDVGFAPNADMIVALGGWGDAFPASWTVDPFSRQLAHPALAGYAMIAGVGVSAHSGEERWWAALEGLAGDSNEWLWPHGPLPEDVRWAWRGENEDGSIVIDCFQAPDGREQCLSTVPEPTTVLLLGTGLGSLALVALLRRRRRRTSALTT